MLWAALISAFSAKRAETSLLDMKMKYAMLCYAGNVGEKKRGNAQSLGCSFLAKKMMIIRLNLICKVSGEHGN